MVVKLTTLGVSLKKVALEIHHNATRLNDTKTENIGMLVGTDIEETYQQIYPSYFFEEYVMLPFEGKEFLCISQYDEMLKKTYGNYMQLPPESKRTSPHVIEDVYWK